MFVGNKQEEKKSVEKLVAAVLANPMSSASAFVAVCLLVTVVWMFSFNQTQGRPLSADNIGSVLAEKFLPKALRGSSSENRMMFAESDASEAQEAVGARAAVRAAAQGKVLSKAGAGALATADGAQGAGGAGGIAGLRKDGSFFGASGGRLKGFKSNRAGVGADGKAASSASIAASGSLFGKALAMVGLGKSASGQGAGGGRAIAAGGRGMGAEGRGGAFGRALGGAARGGQFGGAGGTSSSESSEAQSGAFAAGAQQAVSAGSQLGQSGDSSGGGTPNQDQTGSGGGTTTPPTTTHKGSLYENVVGPTANLTQQMVGAYASMLATAKTATSQIMGSRDGFSGHYHAVDSDADGANGIPVDFGWGAIARDDRLQPFFDEYIANGDYGGHPTPVKYLDDYIQVQQDLLQQQVAPCTQNLGSLNTGDPNYAATVADCMNKTKALLDSYHMIYTGDPARPPVQVCHNFMGLRICYMKRPADSYGLIDVPGLNNTLSQRLGKVSDMESSFSGRVSQLIDDCNGLEFWKIWDCIQNLGAIVGIHDGFRDDINKAQADVGRTGALLNTALNTSSTALAKGEPWTILIRNQPYLMNQVGTYSSQVQKALTSLKKLNDQVMNDPQKKQDKNLLNALAAAQDNLLQARDGWNLFSNGNPGANPPVPPKYNTSEGGPALCELGKLTAQGAAAFAKAQQLSGMTSNDGSGDNWDN